MDVIDLIQQLFGITQETLAFALILVSLACRVIGKLIPDSATGVLAVIRRVAKIIGLQVENRIEPGVTTENVAKASMTIANVARIARKD